MKEYLLGIDVGTSALKAAVFDREGRLVDSASVSYPTYYPAPGFAEQEPDDWWRASVQALRTIFSAGKVRPEDIAAVGTDGQGWANVLTDADGQVLVRTPIWLDTRSEVIAEEMTEKIGEDAIFQLSGNLLRPSYSTGKLLYTMRFQPELFARTASAAVERLHREAPDRRRYARPLPGLRLSFL